MWLVGEERLWSALPARVVDGEDKWCWFRVDLVAVLLEMLGECLEEVRGVVRELYAWVIGEWKAVELRLPLMAEMGISWVFSRD